MDKNTAKGRTMIAIHEDSRSDMVLIYRTLRGFLGGNTEPVNFYSSSGRNSVDENLAVLGHVRITEWVPLPAPAQGYYAKVAVNR